MRNLLRPVRERNALGGGHETPLPSPPRLFKCAVGLLAGDVRDPSSTAGQGDAYVADGAPLAVYGDAAYGAGSLLADLEAAGAQIMTKVQPPVAQRDRRLSQNPASSPFSDSG